LLISNLRMKDRVGFAFRGGISKRVMGGIMDGKRIKHMTKLRHKRGVGDANVDKL